MPIKLQLFLDLVSSNIRWCVSNCRLTSRMPHFLCKARSTCTVVSTGQTCRGSLVGLSSMKKFTTWPHMIASFCLLDANWTASLQKGTSSSESPLMASTIKSHLGVGCRRERPIGRAAHYVMIHSLGRCSLVWSMPLAFRVALVDKIYPDSARVKWYKRHLCSTCHDQWIQLISYSLSCYGLFTSTKHSRKPILCVCSTSRD